MEWKQNSILELQMSHKQNLFGVWKQFISLKFSQKFFFFFNTTFNENISVSFFQYANIFTLIKQNVLNVNF